MVDVCRLETEGLEPVMDVPDFLGDSDKAKGIQGAAEKPLFPEKYSR